MYAVMTSNFRYSCSFYRCFYSRILLLLSLHVVLCCNFLYFFFLTSAAVWRNKSELLALAGPHFSMATSSLVNEFRARLRISHIRDVIENATGVSKPCNGKTVSRTKKLPQKGHTVRTFAIRRNALVKPKTHAVTCNCVTGERSLSCTYRHFGNFKGFYSQNGKSHKKSIRSGHFVGSSSNRWKLSQVEKRNL